MAKFKVGDICIGQNFIFDTECNGMECEIIGGYELREGLWSGNLFPEKCYCYEVVWADGYICNAKEFNLKPRYDGNELVSWSDCAWQPKQLETA